MKKFPTLFIHDKKNAKRCILSTTSVNNNNMVKKINFGGI